MDRSPRLRAGNIKREPSWRGPRAGGIAITITNLSNLAIVFLHGGVGRHPFGPTMERERGMNGQRTSISRMSMRHAEVISSLYTTWAGDLPKARVGTVWAMPISYGVAQSKYTTVQSLSLKFSCSKLKLIHSEPPSPSSFSSRSSATSRPSARSNSTSGSFPRHLPGKSDQERLRDALHREPKKEERPKFHTRNSSTSDLFADVARMTLRSNASNNRTTTPAVETPKPRPPPTGAPASPGRPSIFKSASYVSSSGMSNGSGAGRSKKDKERRAKDKDRVKDEDGIRERDRDREKRRAARHAARKDAASASASGSNTTTTATAKTRRNANIDAVSASPITIPGRNADIEEEGQETPRPVGRSRSPTK